MYSPIVWKHIREPQHREHLAGAQAVGQSRYPRCGDHFILQLRIEGEVIQEARFLAKACAPVVAMGSVGCSLLEGLSLESALQLSAFQLDQALGGLPLPKRHAILMFLESLHEAIRAYQNSQKGPPHEAQASSPNN